jgi:hypothetical protein
MNDMHVWLGRMITFMILVMAASIINDLFSSTLFALFVSSREAIAMRTCMMHACIHTYYMKK